MGGKIRITITNGIVSKELCTDSKIIPVAEISMFFYESENVFAVTKSNEFFLFGMDLTRIENEIGNRFFRLNPQVILNYTSIEYYCHESDQTIRVCTNVSVQSGIFSVCKSRVPEFKDWLSDMFSSEGAGRESDCKHFRSSGRLSG